ncbi:hypothetical protein FC90_GL001175 [Latilactobacillus graminis DSM 20719]|uniref:Uncharacterized protein n=1 Tax=Latilactobacillus graminis DSM 20719 TaxID=1423752 RepID=A0AA89KY17_9LACO|nr:hypothetical protein FC90_GL001175 [Latilactobacillus graminis DSM 20719]
MTKYKLDEKLKAVEQYFNHHQSMNPVSNMPYTVLKKVKIKRIPESTLQMKNIKF